MVKAQGKSRQGVNYNKVAELLNEPDDVLYVLVRDAESLTLDAIEARRTIVFHGTHRELLEVVICGDEDVEVDRELRSMAFYDLALYWYSDFDGEEDYDFAVDLDRWARETLKINLGNEIGHIVNFNPTQLKRYYINNREKFEACLEGAFYLRCIGKHVKLAQKMQDLAYFKVPN